MRALESVRYEARMQFYELRDAAKVAVQKRNAQKRFADNIDKEWLALAKRQ